MDETQENPDALDIGSDPPDGNVFDFNFWVQPDGRPDSTASFKGKATWRIGTLGKRPHIALKFTLRGNTYQMRLYPNREACGPAGEVIRRELLKRAIYDAEKYGTYEPGEGDDGWLAGNRKRKPSQAPKSESTSESSKPSESSTKTSE